MTQIFLSEDNNVSKYIHSDGSETCIKTVPSIETKKNDNGNIEHEVIDRNKYSLFISASKGCPMNCTFCYLTIDDVPFGKVRLDQLIDNLKEAIEHRVSIDPSLKDRYIKICWMGMGEGILQPNNVKDATIQILDWVVEQGYAKGVDGVDISTVLPKNLNAEEWKEAFVKLDDKLVDYDLNPNNKKADNVAGEFSTFVTYKNRSRFRLFFSLHSAIQETRDEIIPQAERLWTAATQLRNLQLGGVDVIIHHMFLDGINDTEQEVMAVVYFMKAFFPDNELRILRYNKHEDSDIKESEVFKDCMCLLGQHLPKIKVQVSQGLDVKSACGQFIYNNTHRVEQFQLEKDV